MKEFMKEIEDPDLVRLRKWHSLKAWSRVRGVDSREDIEQEMLLWCFAKYSKHYDPSRGSLRGFIKVQFSQFRAQYVTRQLAPKHVESRRNASFNESYHGLTSDDFDLPIIEERVKMSLDKRGGLIYSLIREGYSHKSVAELIKQYGIHISGSRVQMIVDKTIRPAVRRELCVQ